MRFIHYLRRYWDKGCVAVNKTESGRGKTESLIIYKKVLKRFILSMLSTATILKSLLLIYLKSWTFSNKKMSKWGKHPPHYSWKTNTRKIQPYKLPYKNVTSIVSDIAGTTRDVSTWWIFLQKEKIYFTRYSGHSQKKQGSRKYRIIILLCEPLKVCDTMTLFAF